MPDTYVIMATIPDCDFSAYHGRAYADAKTNLGPWGFVCSSCFIKYNCELGLGRGQELLLPEEAAERGLK